MIAHNDGQVGSAMPERSDLQGFLDRLARHSLLAKDEQEAILALPCQAIRAETNCDFEMPGGEQAHSRLIVTGMVARFEQNYNGKRQLTAFHFPGEMLGLQAVVHSQATFAFQALCETTMLTVSHASIRSATAKYPALAQAFWRDCVVDAGILTQWIANIGRRNAKSRLAHLFCEIATRRCGAGHVDTFSFPFEVNQLQLADATGLTPIHTNRMLRVLREEGLLDFHKNEVKVLDWFRLVQVGDFDSRYLN